MKVIFIDDVLKNYKRNGNRELLKYINNVVEEKNNDGEWDKGIDKDSENLTTVLMYEYATSIEKLTEGGVSAKDVVLKLENQMGKLCFGDFRQGIDDVVEYDGLAVTSDEYKKQCRINREFGAHAITYKDSNNEDKQAIVLFDDSQKLIVDGSEYDLSGIDIKNLSDIRETVFHEWTHIMERCMIKASKLNKDDIIFKNGNSVYINAGISPELQKQEYEKFVENVDKILKSDAYVTFQGLSTIELNYKKNPNNRIMHNQISEGATQFIARKVMETIGKKIEEPSRYAKQTKIIGDIFEGRGLAETITTYFTQPNKLIKEFENEKVRKKDMLHYISEYIEFGSILRLLNPCKIDKYGNVQSGIISSLFSQIRKSKNGNDVELLDIGKTETKEKEGIEKEKEEFIRELKVDETLVEERLKIQKTNEVKKANRTIDD
ncbi:MAG: hypothetical protein J6M60_04965 [Clostridia bacterium]|nr:hypothetical protein [Clostridia bacterium]